MPPVSRRCRRMAAGLPTAPLRGARGTSTSGRFPTPTTASGACLPLRVGTPYGRRTGRELFYRGLPIFDMMGGANRNGADFQQRDT